MNPVNNINNTSSLTGVAGQSLSANRKDADSAGWFSLSESPTGQTISANSMFDAGTTVEEISSQILSHISQPDNP